MPYQLVFTQVNPAASSKSIIVIPPNKMKTSLFSNNSNVYYKPHSSSYGGVGSVSNSRAISKRT